MREGRSERLLASPLFENYGHRSDDQGEAGQVVPAQGLLQVEDGEGGEDCQGDDFLDGFKLGGGEFVGAYAVGGDLETVFEEGDHPADQDDFEEWDFAEFQVAVPGEGHEDIGDGEQGDGSHGSESVLSGLSYRDSGNAGVAAQRLKPVPSLQIYGIAEAMP